ncbi:MAG TPA: hypothetical protein VH350_17815 [Candidatus Sulfotelmatobacter sp.]|nr:hypothetical protein [Candidatus Sulfotelmatobacter sp.]
MTSISAALKRSTSWVWRRRLRIILLFVVLVLTAPWPARGQALSPCCAILAAGLSSIANSLKTIASSLNAILGVDQGMLRFEQTVVWPTSAITQAQALVGSQQGIFARIQALLHIPVNSATQPNPQQLEITLLSRNPGLIPQTSSKYTALYGPVPTTTDASPQVRDLVDMTDAAAQDAMKRAIQIDALSDLEIQAAGQINQSIQTAAPGSAPIVEAQADAWLVRANAYTQAATADLMRLRAIDLANSSADIKMGATNTANLRQQLMNLLQHN